MMPNITIGLLFFIGIASARSSFWLYGDAIGNLEIELRGQAYAIDARCAAPKKTKRTSAAYIVGQRGFFRKKPRHSASKWAGHETRWRVRCCPRRTAPA